MSLPTFAPPQNPSFDYDESYGSTFATVQTARGYDETRALMLRAPRRLNLQWNAATEATRDYLISFFQQFEGRPGPFLWQSIEKTPSPTGNAPTLGSTSGGALSETTYYVTYTWYDATYGETLESAEASLTVAANNYLTVEVPPLPAGVSSWRLYATALGTGQETLQSTQSSARAVTVTSISEAQASPPTSNTLRPLSRWILASDIESVRIRPGRYRLRISLLEQFL